MIAGDLISWLSLGKVHPLLVHLPIGIYILFALLVLFNKLRNKEKHGSEYNTILFIGALFSTVTSLTGYIFAGFKGYDPSLIYWHRVGGISLSILAWVLWWSYKNKFSELFQYLFITLFSMLLFIVGHFGGSLTHGKDYLFANKSAIDLNRTTKSFDSLNYYTDIIKPILISNCQSCHQSPMLRGGWDMSTDSSLLAGGKYGSTIVPGNTDASELIKRISLPVESIKHMPPSTMPPLDPIEIHLIKHWIQSGAKTDILVSNAEIDDQTKPIIAAYIGKEINKEKEVSLPILTPLPDSAIQSLKNKIGIVNRFSEESSLLDISFVHFRNKNKAELLNAMQALVPFSEYVYVLDLANLNLESNGLKFLSGMKNLNKLNLSNNNIDDEGIIHLQSLTKLESLNLFKNLITDRSIEKLRTYSLLHSITLSETKITVTGIQKWSLENDNLEINY